jgi:hypothetical protein
MRMIIGSVKEIGDAIVLRNHTKIATHNNVSCEFAGLGQTPQTLARRKILLKRDVETFHPLRPRMGKVELRQAVELAWQSRTRCSLTSRMRAGQ